MKPTRFPLLLPAVLATVFFAVTARAQTPTQGPERPPGAAPNPYLIHVAPPAPPAAPSPPPVQIPTPLIMAPAQAGGPSLADLGKSLSAYFTDEELDLLVEYMKESVVAAFKGEEVFLPPDLAFKLEILLARMKKESMLYMDNLMKQLEQDLKRSLRDRLTPPTTPAAVPGPQAVPQVVPQVVPQLAPQQPAPPPAGSSKVPGKKSRKPV